MSKIQLKDICSFSKGSQINGDELIENGEYDYLNGGINPSGKWSNFNVSGDTITISEGGNSCGYVNYMPNPFWCGAHCYYLYDLRCNVKYLYYALKSQQDRIMKLRSGACMPNIKKSDIGSFAFEYTEETSIQNIVVSNLDKITRLIDLCNTILEKLDLLVKSRFVEMFGDFKTNPKGWTIAKFTEIAIIDGNMTTDFEKYADYPHIGQDKPYIAVVKDGAGIGRTMLLPEKTSVIGTMQYLIPNDMICVEYLYYAVTYMNLAKYFSGATIPHIYFKDYQKEKLPLLTIEEQRKISDSLQKIDRLIELCGSILEKIDVLVKSRFVEMFESGNYPVEKLGNVCNKITDGTHKTPTYLDDGIFVVEINGIKT